MRRVIALLAAGTIALIGAPAAAAQSPTPPPDPSQEREQVLGDLTEAAPVGDGVSHREFTTTAGSGQVMGDVVEVDLTQPGVRVDLLSSGTVAGRATVTGMANRSGALAGINGDFFDIGRTNAAAGPAVKDGRSIKAAVPQGRRAAPAVAGAEMDYVFTVGVDRIGRVDRLRLAAEVRGPQGNLPVVALNQHAVPEGGIGIFNADWGDADRGRTLCGSDADRNAPCATEQIEVVVRGGAVAAVGPPGRGAVPDGEIVLVGRDQGAKSLRSLSVGEKVQIDYALVPASGAAPQFAVGGSPILREGGPTERLDDRYRAPRSAAGVSPDGHRMYLVTVDGRQGDSIGATLAELSALLREMGIDDAVNLDGGGSSTLVYRRSGANAVTVVNDPSDSSPRLVGNGIGVYVG
ncbi:MAG: phosphodiester glycosidase family protein [Pseudonocardia sp.]